MGPQGEYNLLNSPSSRREAEREKERERERDFPSLSPPPPSSLSPSLSPSLSLFLYLSLSLSLPLPPPLSQYSGGNHVDWRKNLDRQRGAVFATELKNNSCKIAKWVLAAMLAGSAVIKCGSAPIINRHN